MKASTLVLVMVLGAILQMNGCLASISSFDYRRGPVPQTFQLGTRYPDRSETEECRPIRLRVTRNSRLYRTQLVTNTHPSILFHTSDSRVMSSRLQTRLNALAATYLHRYSARISVLQAWTEYSEEDGIGDPNSLHYEGELSPHHTVT